MYTEFNWVNTYANKLCPDLRERIFSLLNPDQKIPRLFRRLYTNFKQYFSKHRVIVQFEDETVPSFTRNMREMKKHYCPLQEYLPIINGFSATLDLRTLKKLVQQKNIKQIWLDHEVKALLDVATPVTRAPFVWNDSNCGKGIGIAIVDTGVYPHPDLVTPRNRLIAFKDFVKGKTTPYDDNGHGTHSAGNAAGNGLKSKGKYKGPAPEANIIGVKVLDRSGAGTASKIIQGIQWCIDNKDRYGIRIISLSLGASARQSAKKDPLCLAVKKAWNAGIVVCAAAGNTGPKVNTINTPGIEPSIITVGALDDKGTVATGDDTVATFSSRGPTIDGVAKPDFLAPGVKITSLRAPGAYLNKVQKITSDDSWYVTFSGTSMATPICAGVAALLIKKYPKLTPDGVKKRLLQSCRKIKAGLNAQGEGIIDAYCAVTGKRD